MQFELTKEYLQEVKNAIDYNQVGWLKEQIIDLHAADIAEVLDELSTEQAHFVYRLLEEEKAADVLVELEEDVRERFLSSFTSKEIAENIDNLDTDDAADVLAELPEEKKDEVLAQVEDQEHATDIANLLLFKEGTAGALMAKELIKVKESLTVVECLREMRKQAEDLDFIYTVYVVDEEEKLIGILSLKKLLLTANKINIGTICKRDVIFCDTSAPLEDVVKRMEKYDLVVLPVVDESKKLVGRITIDDVVDVIKEEAEKDYRMASGLSEDVESSDTIWVLSRARLPWLIIGLLGGVLGAKVIRLYEHDIHIHPEMAFFIPLIAAMGGNVGVQSSAIIVQGLANNSLGMDSILTKLGKEFSVALLNGFVCALLLFIYNSIFQDTWNLTVTVSSALFAVILFAALFGTLVPLVLNRYKIDPALATGPFITTVNDVFGLLLYFMIGRLLYI